MSASKKRKLRNELEQGMSQKELKEQEELVAAKKKEKTYIVIGIVVVILVAALLIWNTGLFQRQATAVTIGESDYSVVDVSYYYNQALSYEYQMSMYGMSFYDYTLEPDEQIYDVNTFSTYEDYFIEEAFLYLQYVTAMCAEADAAGYTISDDAQAAIDSTYESMDASCAQYGISRSSYLVQSYGEYMTESDFARIVESAALADDYATAYQTGFTYDDADLQAYYEENTDTLDSYDYRVFYISGLAATTTDEDGNTIEATEEETAAAMADALERAEQSVASVGYSSDAEVAFVEASVLYGSETEGEDTTLKEGTTGSTLSSYTGYNTWLMDASRVPGEVTYLESTNGYYVVLFLNRELDTTSTVDIRHILVMADLEDDATEPTAAALADAEAEIDDILSQWESGDKTAESFGLLAEEYSEDSGSNTNGGAYTGVTQGQMFDAFDAWIFDGRQPGDVTTIENPQSGQQGWHAVYFEADGAPYWCSLAESALRSADYTTWSEELLAAYEIVEQSGMKYFS